MNIQPPHPKVTGPLVAGYITVILLKLFGVVHVTFTAEEIIALTGLIGIVLMYAIPSLPSNGTTAE